MNCLLLSPELFLNEDGIARILRLYLKALCAAVAPSQGHVDSLVLNDRTGLEPRLRDYSDDRLREHLGCERRKFQFLREVLRLSRRNDLIVCGHLHLLGLAWLAAKLNPRVKYCLVAHGIEVWRPYNGRERRALLGAARILCVSEFTRRQMLRFCPELDPARLVVLPNTLDPQLTSESPAWSPPALSIATLSSRVLAVGRLSRADAYKGFDLLIEALPQVRRSLPFVQLRIVGSGDDLDRLKAIAQRLGVSDAVAFLGSIDDDALRAEYAGCDLFGLPSRREGFGLVYLEAMTCGKACVGARAGGTPEVISDDTGILVDYGNIPALAEALTELARYPRDAQRIRDHAATFAFPVFQRRLAAALV